MGDFFYGWQRKLGCTVLLAALPLLGGWIRSFVKEDTVTFAASGRTHNIVSSHSQVTWWWEVGGQNTSLSLDSTEIPFNERDSDFHARAAKIYAFSAGRKAIWVLPHRTVSYCAIVVPLLLISAHFFIWTILEGKQPATMSPD